MTVTVDLALAAICFSNAICGLIALVFHLTHPTRG